MDYSETAVTEISIRQGGKEYISRVKRIVECVAKSIGLDVKQASDATEAITEAYKNALRHGILTGVSDAFSVKFQADGKRLTAEFSNEDVRNKLTLCPRIGLTNPECGVHNIRTFAERVEDLSNNCNTITSLTKVVDKHTDI